MSLSNEYMKECRRAGLSAGTIHHRGSILRRVERECGSLLALSTDQLRQWLDRPLSDRSRYCNISHLACFYRWAVLEGHTEHDPTIRLTRPKLRQGLPRPIATEDLAHVLDQADGQVRVMLALAGYCGLRCCEIAALEAGDLYDRREPPLLVVHGKGGRKRVVPLHPVAGELLRGHGVPWTGPVFRRADGRPLPAWKVSQLLRAHMHACGVVASAHQLRHWYATEVLERSGGDLRMVQELLGHSSPATTAIYTAWAQGRASEVVARLVA